jgi:hypothetical protein
MGVLGVELIQLLLISSLVELISWRFLGHLQGVSRSMGVSRILDVEHFDVRYTLASLNQAASMRAFPVTQSNELPYLFHALCHVVV